MKFEIGVYRVFILLAQISDLITFKYAFYNAFTTYKMFVTGICRNQKKIGREVQMLPHLPIHQELQNCMYTPNFVYFSMNVVGLCSKPVPKIRNWKGNQFNTNLAAWGTKTITC